MNKLISINILLTIIFLSGCSSGGDEKEKALSVSQSDFDISGTPLSESSLLFILEDRDHLSLLTNNIIKGAFNSSLLDFIDSAVAFGTGCDFQNFPQFSKNADGEFRLSLSADYLDCPGFAIPPGVSVSAYFETLSITQAVFSENNNPVDVSGKTLNDVYFMEYDINKINFKYGWIQAASQSGVSIEFVEKYAIYATNDFSQACIFQETLITNCTIEYLDSFAGSGFSDVEVVSFEYDGVVPAPTTSSGFDPVYFASGIVKFKVNNWTGTLLYSAPEIPPTYTATDGVKNIQGTLIIN